MDKKTLFWMVAAAAMLSLAACGGSSVSSDSGSDDGDSETEIAQISTLDALPSATDAVEAGTAASSSLVRSLAKVGSSSQGYMALGSIAASDFSQSSSKAACEMFNMTKTAINQAAQGDLIQCYVTSTFEAALAAGSSGIDIYDGSYHVFTLSFPEGRDDGGPSKVKLRVVKNSAGYISTFEMFACGDNGVSDEQTMYLNQSIDGVDFSMTAVNIFNSQYGSGTDKSTVSGKLDANGNFVDSVAGAPTPKEIHMQHAFVNAEIGDNFWGDMIFSQYSDHGALVGTMSGSNSYNSVSCTFQDLVLGEVDLIDGNAEGAQYGIGLLEMGDGAVNVSFAGGCGDQTWSDSMISAWDGTTATDIADASVSPYYNDLVGQALTAASEPSPGFSAGQTWDCSDAAEYTIDFAALEGATGVDTTSSCSRLELSHQHIDCWNIIENGQEGEQQSEAEPEAEPLPEFSCAVDDDFAVDSSSCWTVLDNVPGLGVPTWTTWDNILAETGPMTFSEGTGTLDYDNNGLLDVNPWLFMTKSVTVDSGSTFSVTVHFKNVSGFTEPGGAGLGDAAYIAVAKQDGSAFAYFGIDQSNEGGEHQVCAATNFVNFGKQTCPSGDSNDYYVRLTSVGGVVTAEYSTDGEVWNSIGGTSGDIDASGLTGNVLLEIFFYEKTDGVNNNKLQVDSIITTGLSLP